jgi:ferredoxin
VSFCPFGVYAADAGKVTVVRPRQCKDNCPACARICPELAIIFPKVADRPINGDRVTAADEVEARRRRDERRDALSRGGLREALARRGAGE